ncbi:MAG TPA: transposase [Pirellulales bacterium]|nr:transposase [Pirellulales bacterium]
MARGPDLALRQWWRNLIASFDPERSTVAEFCRRRDVSPASFYAWRRRLGQRLQAEPERADLPAFVPVQVAPQSSSADRAVTVYLPGGVRVAVPSDEQHLLLALVAHLAASSEESS